MSEFDLKREYDRTRVQTLVIAAAPGALMLQLALFRTREFAADATAAALTGDPAGLASALHRIESGGRSIFEQLFPLHRTQQSGLLRTHPGTPERIRRLLALERTPSRQRSSRWWNHPLTGLSGGRVF